MSVETGDSSITGQVAALSDATVAALLASAGLDGAGEAAEDAYPKDSWAFTRDLPATLEAAESGHEGAESCVQRLQRSSTFACPDGFSDMLAAYGLPSRTFQGSVLRRDHGPEVDAALAKSRADLKSDIELAWSQEAVERGVDHARSGNYAAAQECYAQAIELCPNNPDAHVAAGAAHANQKQFDAALSRFQKALELRPGDANALKYRDTVRGRLAEVERAEAGTTRLSADTHAHNAHEARDKAGRAGSPRSEAPEADTASEGSGQQARPQREPRGPEMDTQEALEIVARHYGKRKGSFQSQARRLRVQLIDLPGRAPLLSVLSPLRRRRSPGEEDSRGRPRRKKARKEKHHKSHKRKRLR